MTVKPRVQVLDAKRWARWKRARRDQAALGHRPRPVQSIATACLLSSRRPVVLVTYVDETPRDTPIGREELRRARQELVVQRWNAGATRQQIADELGFKLSTIASNLTEARKAGMHVRAGKSGPRPRSAA